MLFHQVTAFYGNQGGHQHEEFGLSHCKVIKTEASLNDKSEQVRVDQLLDGIFVHSGCLLGPHVGACSSAVFKEKIVLTRNSCLQMARKELDLVVMAQSNVTRTDHPLRTTHGLPLPGCLPTCEQKAVVLLSDMSKIKIYTNYKAMRVQQQPSPINSAFLKI